MTPSIYELWNNQQEQKRRPTPVYAVIHGPHSIKSFGTIEDWYLTNKHAIAAIKAHLSNTYTPEKYHLNIIRLEPVKLGAEK